MREREIIIWMGGTASLSYGWEGLPEYHLEILGVFVSYNNGMVGPEMVRGRGGEAVRIKCLPLQIYPTPLIYSLSIHF